MKSLLMNIFGELWLDLILYADSRPNIGEKSVITLKLLFLSAPTAYFLDQVGHWFATNHEFISFMIYAIVFNMAIGIWYHLKSDSFSWKNFFIKNIEMVGILLAVYFMLEMLNVVAASITGDYFTMLIQLLTLLYPISKSLKNIHILSNYKHPPQFIMNRLYKFNKDGNVGDLFTDKESKSNEKTADD